MIIVTGGAGFIGSNLVRKLNSEGITNILLVDDLTNGNKVVNFQDCQILDYMDKDDLFAHVVDGHDLGKVSAVFHQGACSDTMESDGRFIMDTNYEYSKALLHFCMEQKVPYIYASSASVYGGGEVFVEDAEHEAALNAYAYSKLLFDRYVRINAQQTESQIVGLRYFNVYGHGEAHKGRMASVAYHFHNQYRDNGYVNLFEGSGGYQAGEQLRDFVWVNDVVDVNWHFYQNPDRSGIFNVGTGRAQSFNDVATAVLNTLEQENKTTQEWVDANKIRYIDFPAALVGKYQSYTKADLTNLKQQGGYQHDFATVEQGVAHYLERLANA